MKSALNLNTLIYWSAMDAITTNCPNIIKILINKIAGKWIQSKSYLRVNLNGNKKCSFVKNAKDPDIIQM